MQAKGHVSAWGARFVFLLMVNKKRITDPLGHSSPEAAHNSGGLKVNPLQHCTDK